MKQTNTSREEKGLLQIIKELLAQEPELEEQMARAGMEVERMDDPQYADYLGDLTTDCGPQEFTPAQLLELLRREVNDRSRTAGHMITARSDKWERYPLDALLRLLWRASKEEGEILFMRGEAGMNHPPVIWKAEIRNEQQLRVLRCYDDERRNYMYLVLEDERYAISRKALEKEIREFLNFCEDSVWLCSASCMQVKEVGV